MTNKARTAIILDEFIAPYYRYVNGYGFGYSEYRYGNGIYPSYGYGDGDGSGNGLNPNYGDGTTVSHSCMNKDGYSWSGSGYTEGYGNGYWGEGEPNVSMF